ncbi:MAG: hypothetical protein GX066_08685 [Clostridiaceae bacterium]|nr:hypothetical protein [Clostridiaceae bacterium]
MVKKFVMIIVFSGMMSMLLSGCGLIIGTRVATSTVQMPSGEIKIKSVTHDAEGVLKKGDKVHIKVEVENYDPELTPKMGLSEMTARIANQPGEILLRNDGTLGDTTADDNFFEGEYIIDDQSKKVVNGKIVVNTYREQVFSEKTITIDP